jgi:hypothetical protein
VDDWSEAEIARALREMVLEGMSPEEVDRLINGRWAEPEERQEEGAGS